MSQKDEKDGRKERASGADKQEAHGEQKEEKHEKTAAKLSTAEITPAEIPWNPEITIQKDEVWKDFDSADSGTPDEWIPRHPALIRLTGRHPLNAEPPSQLLTESGFITPSSLHYVRNHGRVPKLDWNSHKVKVSGLVSGPHEFSMDELEKMPSITVAVTLTCDGNRRKELNLIKKGRAFNWGSGATSCSVWKGVPLHLILEKCGVKTPEEGARFICFEGSDKELLNQGVYGTSLPIAVAMDKYYDILLAYEMNGHRLTPDHGFPVRLVVPGHVGGRMVKWLSKIEVSSKESQSWYHWHDNKVLPQSIDFPLAETGHWWQKPGYILYELNINSVITHPGHEEWICDPNMQDKYTIRGYSYTGGGRRIARVEVSFDQGKNWVLAKLQFLENSIRHGFKFWSWCLWTLEVPLWQIVAAPELVCRAWDLSGNVQPEKHNWNVLGMFNNSWYRVQVSTASTSLASPSITFKHPCAPGSLGGGWMVSEDQEPKPPMSVDWHGMIAARHDRRFTRSEVAKHNKPDDCWVIIDGSVYDVTSYLKEHPGGGDALLINGGGIATLEFNQIHSPDAHNMKEMFCLGIIYERPEDILQSLENVGLTPRRWTEATLIEKESISTTTRKFRFQLPDGKLVGLPIGQHVLLGDKIKGQWLARPYTPTSPVGEDEDQGIVELLVKIYYGHEGQPGGQMSTHLDTLKKGDKVKLKGPCGHIFYSGNGTFSINGGIFTVKKRVSLIAGGTGITPVYQLIRAILKKDKKLEIAVLYASESVEEILLRKELDDLVSKHRDKLKVWYTVSKKPEGEWKFSVGRIDGHMVSEYLFPASPCSIAFVCGPPAMEEEAAVPNLERLGYTYWNIFEFG